MNTRILLGILILNLNLSAWDLAKSKDGITIYTRAVEGSNLKEFKAITQVKSTLPALIALLKDEASFPEWYPDNKSAKILKEFSPSDWIIYFHIGAPFPVSDRDMNNRFTITQNPKNKAVNISLSTDPKFIPEKSGLIRIPKLKGYWQFTPNDETGTVEIIYQLHSEPGGSIPDFLANSAVTDSPFKVLTNLKKIIQKEKYQTAKFDFIK